MRTERRKPRRAGVQPSPAVNHPKGVQDGGIASKESVLSTTRFPEAVWADEPMVQLADR